MTARNGERSQGIDAVEGEISAGLKSQKAGIEKTNNETMRQKRYCVPSKVKDMLAPEQGIASDSSAREEPSQSTGSGKTYNMRTAGRDNKSRAAILG
jgi:hypothetical protein